MTVTAITGTTRARARALLALLALVPACVSRPFHSQGPGPLPDVGSSEGPAPNASNPSQPPTSGVVRANIAHPRLWFRESDLPAMKAAMTDRNPLWRDGLSRVVADGVLQMDAGKLPNPARPGACVDENEVVPCEAWAEIFAFRALLARGEPDEGQWVTRAKKLLFAVLAEADRGPDESRIVRTAAFPVDDRSRWYGESFPLVVDWLHDHLSADERALVVRVFARWAEAISHAEVTTANHPEPRGVYNQPELVRDPKLVRWSLNNYYAAHARNLALMALALDPADDPNGAVRGRLREALGAWLYVIDHAMRTEARGGLPPEGFEYGPQTYAYIGQLLWALTTAGEDDARTWGPQVASLRGSAWKDVYRAWLHSLPPVTSAKTDQGNSFEPAWYGEGQHVAVPDPVELFAPLARAFDAVGRTTEAAELRWSLRHAGPGGAEAQVDRARDGTFPRRAILHFAASLPDATELDPRPSLGNVYHAHGVGRALVRTGWAERDRFVSLEAGWVGIDHQTAGGGDFGFFRRGEWLTRRRVGYGDVGSSSDQHNTVCVQNARPAHGQPGDYRYVLWQRGSQWTVELSNGPGRFVSFADTAATVSATVELTPLYQSTYEGATQVGHVSRSIVWAKPDHIVVYDRVAALAEGRFKRVFFQTPATVVVRGKQATARTEGGQELSITQVLPDAGSLVLEPVDKAADEEAAEGEPMKRRVRAEAPLRAHEARFLHVVQGQDAGASSDAVERTESRGGTATDGVVLRGTSYVFLRTLGATPKELSFLAPSGTAHHVVTGLAAHGRYDTAVASEGGKAVVTVRTGSAREADAAGTLSW